MSQSEDMQKLQEALSKAVTTARNTKDEGHTIDWVGEEDVPAEKTSAFLNTCCQWTSNDGIRFIPASKTAPLLTPGAYEILSSHNIPIYFEKIPILATNLINFPETNSEKVVSEIQKFWSKESVFRDFGLVYKRGIILWGPPGSGKSCTIQLVMRDVVARGGVVIKFTHPGLFNDGIRKFREVQPDTPLVVLMEDIDSIIQIYNESEVLNILDGVNQVDKVVFLATTNYPEQLGGRIINRPSRFDRRFRIPHPGRNSRKLYLEHLIGNREIKIDIERWADDTEDFSVAHLKELFTSVVIFGNDYEEELETLQSMREVQPSSIDDEYRKPMGFAKQCSSRTPNYPR